MTLMKKQCSRCKIPKLLDDFHRNKRQVDGRQVWCKICVREHQNQQREDHREQYRQYQRTWFENHPGYFRTYNRKPKKVGGSLVVFDED